MHSAIYDHMPVALAGREQKRYGWKHGKRSAAAFCFADLYNVFLFCQTALHDFISALCPDVFQISGNRSLESIQPA